MASSKRVHELSDEELGGLIHDLLGVPDPVPPAPGREEAITRTLQKLRAYQRLQSAEQRATGRKTPIWSRLLTPNSVLASLFVTCAGLLVVVSFQMFPFISVDSMGAVSELEPESEPVAATVVGYSADDQSFIVRWLTGGDSPKVIARVVAADGSLSVPPPEESPCDECLRIEKTVAWADLPGIPASSSETHMDASIFIILKDDCSGGDCVPGFLLTRRGVGGGELPDAMTGYLSGDDTAEYLYPTVAYSRRSDMFMIAWSQRKPNDPDGWDIYGVALTGDGQVWTTPKKLAGGRGEQSVPSLGYDPARNKFLVAWSAYGSPDLADGVYVSEVELRPGLEARMRFDVWSRQLLARIHQ